MVEMRTALGLIFVSGICGFWGVSAGPVALKHVIRRDLSDSTDEMYKSYFALTNGKADHSNELDVISQVQKVYLDDANVKQEKPQKVRQTAYVIVKSTRQRDKRYISYITLCHFKICNMGRKRTTRYFHMMRELDNDS